jgi:hypothetical protein
MYLMGGYAYTPEELDEFFEKQYGESLEEPGIGVKASRCLERHHGHPYIVRGCMLRNEFVFLFAVSYIPLTFTTLHYRFEETEEALKMKEALKIDKPFVTAVY